MSFSLNHEPYRPSSRQQIEAYSSDGSIVAAASIKRFILLEAYNLPYTGKNFSLPPEYGYSLLLTSLYFSDISTLIKIWIVIEMANGAGTHMVTLVPSSRGGVISIPPIVIRPGAIASIRHSWGQGNVPYLNLTGEPCIVLDTLGLE